MQYRKKPVVVDAIEWTGHNLDAVKEFVDEEKFIDFAIVNGAPDLRLFNEQEQQWIGAPIGHWIIKGVKGEFYPCSPEVFAQTYEEVQ